MRKVDATRPGSSASSTLVGETQNELSPVVARLQELDVESCVRIYLLAKSLRQKDVALMMDCSSSQEHAYLRSDGRNHCGIYLELLLRAASGVVEQLRGGKLVHQSS
jgi:hypothetical protein